MPAPRPSRRPGMRPKKGVGPKSKYRSTWSPNVQSGTKKKKKKK